MFRMSEKAEIEIFPTHDVKWNYQSRMKQNYESRMIKHKYNKLVFIFCH